jgi:hypothetical protein
MHLTRCTYALIDFNYVAALNEGLRSGGKVVKNAGKAEAP